jgi:hypothetical protein
VLWMSHGMLLVKVVMVQCISDVTQEVTIENGEGYYIIHNVLQHVR